MTNRMPELPANMHWVVDSAKVFSTQTYMRLRLQKLKLRKWRKPVWVTVDETLCEPSIATVVEGAKLLLRSYNLMNASAIQAEKLVGIYPPKQLGEE